MSAAELSAARAPARIAVVGFPNAGKSTLVNRLAGGREAVVDSEPGVTRDRKEIACEWNGQSMTLIDTGGIDVEAEDALAESVRTQARMAIHEADAIMLVVDARTGLGPGDAEVAKILRVSEAPVIVVANKLDRVQDEPLAAELYQLGLGKPFPVSSAHGLGTGDLLDELAKLAASIGPITAPDPSIPRIAIIGRPNAGKSSLVNAFLGSDRVIVSDQAGTTRDAIDTRLIHHDRELILVDTAGLRKRSKVAGTVGYYAQLRAEQATSRADVAMLVVDAFDGITSEDLRIGELAMHAGCATVVALNKWDITRTELAEAAARISKRMRQRPPMVTTSAHRNRNLPSLLDTAVRLADRRGDRIQTAELNRWLEDAVARTPPPARRGKRLRTYYIAQVGERPPRFAIQVNDRRLLQREWSYYLENEELRAAFGLEGVPVIIDFMPRKSRRAAGGSDSSSRL